AHDDLLPHGLGLGGHLGIVLHLDHHDLLLLVQDVLAHLRLVPEAGVQSGNLHGHVLADLLHLLSGQVGLQVHQHTDLAAGVHIGHGDVLGEAGEAADLDVLADHQHHLLLLLGDGQVGADVLALHQRVQVGGSLLGHSGGHALDEVHELLVLAHEVGLGVDLDHHAHAVDDGGIGHTLGGNAAGLLGGGGHALLAQPLHGLVHIAVGGGQRLLAIHHAHAGHLAQVLYISCGKSHFEFLQTVLVYTRKCRRRLLSVGSSLFRGGLSGLLTLLALQHGVGHDGGDQLDGADGVVVAGDHIIDLIGIAVGIGDGHHGNTQLVGLGDGVALLAGVHDEQGAGQLLHFLHAAQVLLQLGDLAQVLHDFLLGQHVEGAVLLHGLQLVQPVH
ncbi:Tyrosine recombinase XerC, partial [Dysosmobacter welbionis]